MGIMQLRAGPRPAEPEDRLAQLKLRIAGRLKQGLHSRMERYGLRRDLSVAIEPPAAKIPIAVRPLRPEDLDVLLPLGGDRPQAEKLDIVWRRGFHRKVPQGGHVAVDLRDGRPCYLQWLLGHSDRALVRDLGGFPELQPGEALLENAFTPVSHRGLGIMSAAMAMIAERADAIGARHVLTFVGTDNPASLKGCARAGFHPYLLHRRSQYGFGTIARHTFHPLP